MEIKENTSQPSSAARQNHPTLDVSHVEIEDPDYNSIRQQRIARNRETMEAADRNITKEILPESFKTSIKEKAALQIQKHYRGYRGRQIYVQKLFEKYEQEERSRLEKLQLHIHEGELLVNNYQLEVSLGDSRTVRRNRDRLYSSQVLTIQRAWRNHKRNNTKTLSIVSPPLSDSDNFNCKTSYNKCESEDLRIPKTLHEQTTPDNDASTEFQKQLLTTQSQKLNNQSELSTRPRPVVVIYHESLQKPSPKIAATASERNPRSHQEGSRSINLDSNPPQVDLSDHDDETSETESTAAGMTLLTPEENQGGGEEGPSSADQNRTDEINQGEIEEGGGLAETQPHSSESVDSSPTIDLTDISPAVPEISDPVPGIQPVLDSATILSSPEEDQPQDTTINSNNPSSLTAEVDETRSIASSDYSELGGPLRDLDVAALDREAALSARAGHPSDISYLDDLYKSFDGSCGGFCLKEGGGLKQEEREEEEGVILLEKFEGETEEEFDKRVKKVNYLSLAQEFAELKKRDARACPINHAKRRSGSLVRGGSESPRGVSLDRKGGSSCGRRTQSRSPARWGLGVGLGGLDPNTVAESRGLRAESKSPARGTTQSHTMSSGCGAVSTSSSCLGDLPRNLEKQLMLNDSGAAVGSGLPANEAKRTGSDDLPVNMRPGRQKGVGGAGEERDGDFDIYTMESAVPELNWDMVESQIQERMRRESCKNDREEIRRRLAMTTDEEFGDEKETTEASESQPFLMSPRNKRLQARLAGAPSGMQICFMNDDMLDDDDDDYNDDLLTPGRGEVDRLLPGSDVTQSESGSSHPNHPCYGVDVQRFASRQDQLQSEATLALAQASTMARMQLEVEKQNKKKSPIADMVGIPTLGNGRRLRLSRNKLQEMSLGQLQVLVNDLHSQIELLNEDLVHLLIERDDLHMEQDSMLVDIEDLTSHCQDPAATNNNKSTQNKNRLTSRRDRHK